MSKRSISSVALLMIGVVIGMAIGPLHTGASFAQGDCRTFPETGKQVCGRFLEYWTNNGGLAQQGLPLTNEFVEVSDLNGKSYTVQYFERAVFEKHPENAAPYDVLLSQLGTFRLAAKYPGGDPSRNQTPVPVPPAPTATQGNVPAGDSASFSGNGPQNTDAFHLTGGNYKADWTAQAGRYGCLNVINFHSVDPSKLVFQVISNKAVGGNQQAVGSTNIFNLEEGDYYFSVNSGCDWTVEIHK